MSTPEEQGFNSARLAEGLLAIREHKINIHSLLILRNGYVILDAYFYPYDGKTVHELASVAKSVMTALIAIAVDQGRLKLDQPVVSYFSDRTMANRDFLKDRVTVRHLAGMTSGLDCTAAHDEQTLHEMELYPDWVQFTLDRRMIYKPGKHFEFCSPGMHVLAAILQNTTGMTALEYACIDLFNPLGIQDVIWDFDPQGYNDGWAGLYLHPRDIAKIGYLWLNRGQWEDKQIVSRKWVKESVKRQTKTGMGDDYGYGWWAMPGNKREYAAEGRSGQYIRVFPAWNAIVVTTDGGFDWNEIAPFIASAVQDRKKALPSNTAGVEKLNAALATVQKPTDPQPGAPLSETAQAISRKTFVFEPNPTNLKTLHLDFDGSNEAGIRLSFTNQPDRYFLVGLDGIYRTYPVDDYNLEMGLRGSWSDAQTFLLEFDRIANREAYTLLMNFDGGGVAIDIKERTQEAAVRIEGKLKKP